MRVPAPASPPGATRIAYVDLAKVAAIVAVAAIHASDAACAAGPVGSGGWRFAMALNGLCRWSVPVFLMASGMFFLDPGRAVGVGKLYRGPIPRILTAFVAWGCVYLVWNGRRHFEPILVGLLHGGNPHLGFLMYLGGLYVLVPILRVFARGADKAEWRYFFTAWFLASSLAPFILQYLPQAYSLRLNTTLNMINVRFFMNYAGYFLFGYYFLAHGLSKRAEYALYLLGIAGAAVTVWGTAALSEARGAWRPALFGYNQPNVVLMSAAALVAFSRAAPFLERHSRAARVVESLSLRVFGVYLVHELIRSIVDASGLLSSFPVYLSIPLTVAVVLAVSFALAHLWVEARGAVRKLKYTDAP